MSESNWKWSLFVLALSVPALAMAQIPSDYQNLLQKIDGAQSNIEVRAPFLDVIMGGEFTEALLRAEKRNVKVDVRRHPSREVFVDVDDQQAFYRYDDNPYYTVREVAEELRSMDGRSPAVNGRLWAPQRSPAKKSISVKQKAPRSQSANR